jgi:hypothetical protein
MSFGQADARIGGHIADLQDRALRSRTRTPARAGAHGGIPSDVTFRLRNRIGLGLVELGLHLMVRSRESTAPRFAPGPAAGQGGSALLRPSSISRGR